MPAKIEMTGKRFGKLTVLEEFGRSGSQVTWRCICDCGNEHVAKGRDLRCGDVKSCGCLKPTYGEKVTGTRLHRIWKAMKYRCSNKNGQDWYLYGEKGITVCDEWSKNYLAFKKWAESNGYQEDLTIDRINSNKGYCPENCRWATPLVQANNTSRNHVVDWNGESKTIAEWSRVVCIDEKVLWQRFRSGWSAERALTEPINQSKRKNRNGLFYGG